MMKTLSVIAIALLLSACQSPLPEGSNTEQNRTADREHVKSELEISLKADRDQFAELRKEVPQEKQKKNDELALYLEVMRQGTEQPSIVRERFSAIVQKRRDGFRNKVMRLREDFRKDETRRREDFLKEHKNRRDSFAKKKHDSQESREFFAEQEQLRQRFFADERDRRQSFESEISSQSKDFESFMRERNNEFNERFRIYSKKFYEKPKETKAVTGDSGGGFDKLKNMEAAPLGTDN
jgi:hypothetical protein